MNSKKLFAAVLAAVLIAGCQKNTAPSSSGALVSVEKTSFDEVTAKLDKGGSLYVYLSTEQFLNGLSGRLTGLTNMFDSFPNATEEHKEIAHRALDFVTAWIKDSGVEEISGLGMSSIARETNFYFNKIVVYHYPGQNEGVIWSAFGESAHPLTELDMLPETTALAVFSDLDVPLVWSDVQKRVEQLNIPGATEGLKQWPEQFHKMTGLEFDKVLASLGGNYGFLLTLDPAKKISIPSHGGTLEAPAPALALIAKVKSDMIFDRVDALATNNPMVVRVDSAELKMRTMTIPLPLPVELRPSIARVGDYLILASSDALVQDLVAVKAGKKKSVKTTAEFARLSQGIPLEGNSFTFVSDSFVKTIMQVQKEVMAHGTNMTASQYDALQHAFNSATNYGTFSVGAYETDGWEARANGSQSIQAALLPMVFGIGAAAAILIPSYIKAHAKTQTASNLPARAALPLVSATPSVSGSPLAMAQRP